MSDKFNAGNQMVEGLYLPYDGFAFWNEKRNRSDRASIDNNFNGTALSSKRTVRLYSECKIVLIHDRTNTKYEVMKMKK